MFKGAKKKSLVYMDDEYILIYDILYSVCVCVYVCMYVSLRVYERLVYLFICQEHIDMRIIFEVSGPTVLVGRWALV